MAKSDRQLLNERFKQIFALLEERGEVVRSDRKKGLSVFAERLLNNRQYGHIIGKYLSGERLFPFKYVKRLCELYQVSETFMLQGKGDPFEPSEQYELKGDNQCDQPEITATNNIVFSNIEAFASSTIDVSIYEESQRFHIPGMQGEHIAFYIHGDSMSPTVMNGDMVICKVVEPHEPVLDNEIYAIVTNNSVMVKRVQKIYNQYRKLTELKLISDNYLEHDPFFVTIKDIRRILKVERRLTGLGL